jgi:hypothetical protein
MTTPEWFLFRSKCEFIDYSFIDGQEHCKFNSDKKECICNHQDECPLLKDQTE